MDLLSLEFASALAAIVLIDIVLAGDNAIVIALAARNLPERLRKRAILWGAFGAVAVRSLMTLGVVWLLRIPGLLALGGVLLLWIAYRLITPNDGGHGEVSPAGDFLGAMKTIIVADAVMGIDNVLGVAGAAHGSYLLVVLGLLISVPIVIWGSTLILRATERFPAIIYAGAAVLAITGTKMALSEPLLRDFVPGGLLAALAIQFAAAVAVLLVGLHCNTTRRLRAALRVQASVRRGLRRDGLYPGGAIMQKVLLPVDGSENALAAVREVVRQHRGSDNVEVVLLNVQPRFSRHVAQFVARRNREDFHLERARLATRAAKELLERWNIRHQTITALGDRARTIADVARAQGCHRIVLGIARKNSLTRLVENSATAKLLEIAPIPVEIVAGEHASRLERIGVPLGVGAALAALFFLD
jgi:YjbE family integral membrane protein